MAAGNDSTANLLSWSAYVLATQHDVQETLRQEILQLVGNNHQPQYAGIDNLVYLNAFVKDVMRVYPPGMRWSMTRKKNLLRSFSSILEYTPY
jgi:cytochrome P450